jgi:hypothetical protein
METFRGRGQGGHEQGDDWEWNEGLLGLGNSSIGCS